MRRVLAGILIVIIGFFPHYALALEPEAYPGAMGEAGASALGELSFGQPLFSDNADTPLEPAGLLRLPALLVVCRAVDEGRLSLSDDVRVSGNAIKMRGASAFLDANESMKVSELLKSAVMICAGDAIYALCEAIEPSQTVLMQKINALLEELGISAQYTDINGSNVKLSANDLLKLGRALAQSKAYCTYSGLYYYELVHQSGRKTELASSNKLLNSCPGCFGLATGSSPSTGYSGIYAVRRGDATFICVVLGAKNNAQRSSIATEMIEYAFSVYKTTTIAKAGKAVVSDIPVEGGTRQSVALVSNTDVKVVNKGDTELTKAEQIPQALRAPFTTMDVVGSITYTDGAGNVVATVELSPAESIQEAELSHYCRQIMLDWVHK